MKIKSLSTKRMRQQQAFEFYNRVYNKVYTIKFDPLKPYIEKFDIATAEFDTALKPLRKSLLTEKITNADERRDTAWRGLNATVQLYLNHIDEGEKELAKKADRIISTYGDPTRLPYTEETGVIRNLLTDLNKAFVPANYTLLPIQKWLDALETANQEFSTLSKQRTNEQATLISGESKAKRQEADKAYKTLVEMINAFALTADNPQVFKETIQNVNRLIDYENAVMKARDTRNKQKNASSGEEETE